MLLNHCWSLKIYRILQVSQPTGNRSGNSIKFQFSLFHELFPKKTFGCYRFGGIGLKPLLKSVGDILKGDNLRPPIAKIEYADNYSVLVNFFYNMMQGIILGIDSPLQGIPVVKKLAMVQGAIPKKVVTRRPQM